jgi:CRP-like cAMP-binding protein
MNRSVARPVVADLTGPDWLKAKDAVPELLASVPLFHGLDPTILTGLTDGCSLMEVPEGTRLIEEGEQGDRCFIVIKGRLQAVRRSEGQEVLLSEMTRGDSVGEAALLESSPRAASVIAAEPSRLIVLSRETFERVVAGTPDVRRRLTALIAERKEWARHVRERPASAELLRHLAALTRIEDVATLRALEKEVSWHPIPARTVLFRQGDPGDALYLVLEGELEIVGRRADGSRVRIGRVAAGASLGEMALLTQEPRSADVVASTDAALLKLSKAGYESLVRIHPATTQVLSHLLAARLSEQLQARMVRTQIGSMPLPTDDEIREIVETPGLVLRNLRITQMYFQLSLQMAGLLGQQDANWCTFATHASKTAGYSIRREEMPGYGLVIWIEDHVERFAGIERLANAVTDRIVARSDLAARLEGITRHISNCISAGNLKVFAELAPVFAAFLRAFQASTRPDPEALKDVLALLDPGDVNLGGQQLLGEALSHYHAAMFERDMKRKAELILLANCLIGLHEQTRLQPYIVEALDTPMGDILDTVRDRMSGVLPKPGARAVSRSRDRVGPEATRLFRILATRTIMSLRLPYGDVGLGRDLPRLPNRRIFPDVLETVELEPLQELVQRYDRTRGSLRNSRSSDWGSLDQRMNTIISLFRSRQKSYELFEQPFLHDQRRKMSDGVVPRGRL